MKVLIDGVEFFPRHGVHACQPWADRIKAVRTARKDSLDAMARATGLSKTYLWELENREAIEPSLNTIRLILRYAGESFEAFFGLD